VEEVRAATQDRCPIELKMAPLGGETRADENLLRHVLLNLLSNAVKYSPAGSPVELGVQPDGDHVVFEVRDRGIGIPAEDRERLFTAFHRGQNVGQIPGTGLGLSIVKRCVDRHGGRIRVEDATPSGTVFTVAMPMLMRKG